MEGVMVVAAALLCPLFLLGLLLAMERVERPLRAAELDRDLESFLDTARPDEVDTFVSQGFAAALERYGKRRRSQPGRHRGGVAGPRRASVEGVDGAR
jgi:hypothetical protein